MKKLKNQYKNITINILKEINIFKAIKICYSTGKPTQVEVVSLYFKIGQSICSQGEKAYIPHLEKILNETYADIKGFSTRNLRRMRDFYLTYENNSQLSVKALMLNWTQNTVILEYIENPDDREFYIDLTLQNKLTKTELITAIENNLKDSQMTDPEVETVCHQDISSKEIQVTPAKTNVCSLSRDCGELRLILDFIRVFVRGP